MQVDLDMIFISEVPGQRVRGVDAPMLAAGAAKADTEAGEPSCDKIFHGDVDDVIRSIQELRHPGLLFEEVLDRLVAARQGPELLHPAGVEDTPAIEDKTAAVTALIGGYCFPVGKASDMHDQGSILIGLDRLEAMDQLILYEQCKQAVELGQRNPRVTVVDKPLQISQREGNTDQEMGFPLEKAPESICAQHLQEPDQHVAIVLSDEGDPVDLLSEELIDAIHIVIQQRILP